MARSFHRKKPLEAQSELNVTALIDLGFALLIIFMIATPLIEQDQVMEVDLPESSKSTTEAPPNKVDLVIKDGAFNLNGKPMDVAALTREFEFYSMEAKPPVFSIRMDKDTVAQDFVTVLDLLKTHGLRGIHINTKVEQE